MPEVHDYLSPLWDALFLAFATACPQVRGTEGTQPIFWESQMERVDWSERLSDGSLTAPWAFIEWPQLTKVDWGYKYDFYEAQCKFFYIAHLGDTGSGDVVADIQAALLALRTYIWSGVLGYDVLSGPVIDMGVQNGLNSVFLEANLPYLGGVLTFSCLVGDINPRGN